MTLLSKIEPHAARLEQAADRMVAEGVGADPTQGHVAVLRALAADLRASATVGRIPIALTAVASTVNAAAEMLTPLKAAAARSGDHTFATRINRLGNIARRLAHHSYDPSKPIDLAAFDRETRQLGRPLTEPESRERMAWKTEAARLGLVA